MRELRVVSVTKIRMSLHTVQILKVVVTLASASCTGSMREMRVVSVTKIRISFAVQILKVVVTLASASCTGSMREMRVVSVTKGRDRRRGSASSYSNTST